MRFVRWPHLKCSSRCVDGTELRLGEEGSLTLSKFVYAPRQKSHHVLVRIATGAFRAVTKNVLPQATFEVQTATAVAAVRGTEWMGQVSADATAIFVVQGQVAVRHVQPDIGGEVVVTAGMGTDVRGTSPANSAWEVGRGACCGIAKGCGLAMKLTAVRLSVLLTAGCLLLYLTTVQTSVVRTLEAKFLDLRLQWRGAASPEHTAGHYLH